MLSHTTSRRTRKWMRLIALILSELMLSNSTVYADDIKISPFQGRILEHSQGSDKKTIVHIKDAHCILDSQSNINKMIKALALQGYDVIGLEGAEGPLDVGDITSFPDPETRSDVAHYFMEKGVLSGAEYFALNETELDIRMVGVENRDLYLKNYQALMRSLEVRKTAKKYCSSLNKVLSKIKEHLFTGDLADIDKVYRDYAEERINFYQFSKYMDTYVKKYNIDLWLYENYSLMREAHSLEEKLDFEKVKTQRSALVDRLAKALPEPESVELVRKNIAYKLEQMKPLDFHQVLITTANTHNVPLDEFPEVVGYMEYLKLFEKINIQDLFEETDAILSEIKEKLYEKQEQRDLDRYGKSIHILENFFDLKLLPHELEYYINNTADFRTQNIVSFIETYANQFKFMYFIDANMTIIDNSLPLLEEFYTLSKKRDKFLLENLLAEMELEGHDKGVLITGGFHTEGMTKLMKEKGISYYVVAPVIHE
ncbi:MAG: hypothetical protein H7A34_08640, partial [bacterium]|nr:hypothetical protein [bacterium]